MADETAAEDSAGSKVVLLPLTLVNFGGDQATHVRTTKQIDTKISTPLWYYILKEAEVAGGTRLAGVGARIVAEVFLGLLSLDSNSYLARNPQWRPTLPGRRRGTFGIVDFLTLAGVDPASRGQ